MSYCVSYCELVPSQLGGTCDMTVITAFPERANDKVPRDRILE